MRPRTDTLTHARLYIGVGQNNRNTTETVNISVLMQCWATSCLPYFSIFLGMNSYKFWTVCSRFLYNSSWRTFTNYCRGVAGGLIIFKCGDFTGQGRGWSSPLCSSNYDWSECFYLCEWGNSLLAKPHSCSEVTSGLWNVTNYPTSPHTPLQ
jgi:hypothetical protein